MDAFGTPTAKTTDRRRYTISRPARGWLILGVLLFAACSSNTKPEALPPQTMAPKPPDSQEPVSSAPQEMEPDQLPSTGEPVLVDPTPETTDASGENDPLTLVIDPATTDAIDENDPLTLVIEPAREEESEGSNSLYQAAQQEKARRADLGQSTIVLNDKNLKKYSKDTSTSTEDGPGTSEGEGNAAAEAGEETAEEPSLQEQERYWRDRVFEIRADWRQSLDRIGELEGEIAGLRRNFYAEDDPFYRDSQIKPAWDRSLEELDETRRAAERHQVELEDVLDEGRREGALPGWLREGIELEPTEEELAEILPEQSRFHEPSEPVIANEDDGGGR